ncbi:MAG: ribose 5-phosphate isomerase B [archaeon]
MIGIGSDHGGYELKEKVKAQLALLEYACKDFGTSSLESCDYPDSGEAVANCVASGECERGIVICTTGIGISIAANKVKGVRAALCRDVDSAVMTRRHNDANVLALGAKYTGERLAKKIVEAFLRTEFDGPRPDGERHKKRVDKIKAIESRNFK